MEITKINSISLNKPLIKNILLYLESQDHLRIFPLNKEIHRMINLKSTKDIKYRDYMDKRKRFIITVYPRDMISQNQKIKLVQIKMYVNNEKRSIFPVRSSYVDLFLEGKKIFGKEIARNFILFSNLTIDKSEPQLFIFSKSSNSEIFHTISNEMSSFSVREVSLSQSSEPNFFKAEIKMLLLEIN
jgi:hypothetical protein